MKNRRNRSRLYITLPFRIEWVENGITYKQEGLTENIGHDGALLGLVSTVPQIGACLKLTIIERPEQETSVNTFVLRVERNVCTPKIACVIDEDDKDKWIAEVCDYAQALLTNKALV